MATHHKALEMAGLHFKPNLRRRMTFIGLGFVLPFMIVYAVVVLWPIVLGIRMSFFNWSLLAGSLRGLGFANYRQLFQDAAFWGSLWHTVVFTILSTPPLVILSLALALLVHRKIPAQGVFRLIFFAPFVLPVSIGTLIWGWMYEPGFGLIDSYLTQFGLHSVNWLTDTQIAMASIVIFTVWWTIGFNFILYLAGLQDIPRDIYEAAEVDGGGRWALLRYITLPLLKRTTILIIVLQILASLKVFDQVYLLTNGGPNNATRPIILYIYQSGFETYRIGYASAMSYVFFLIIVIISVAWFLVSRRQQKGAVQ